MEGLGPVQRPVNVSATTSVKRVVVWMACVSEISVPTEKNDPVAQDAVGHRPAETACGVRALEV